MLAPILVPSTLGVLATGVALLVLGPPSRHPVLVLHKLFFFAWLAACGIHVLAHLPEVVRVGSRARRTRTETLALTAADRRQNAVSLSGGRVRALALLASVVAGLALATSLIGLFHAWTVGG
jgi:hypothetical protein